MDAARFRPTWQQALGHGMYLGALAAAAVLVATLGVLGWTRGAPPHWVWPLLAFGPPLAGAVAGVLLRPRLGTTVDAGGIRTVTPFRGGVEPWSRVVDLRAERRGGRNVVSVYLESGASVQLRAPYSGELFAADPQFELKVFALSHLWRSHRFGGVPS
ncbi:PH domain-containing protein [Actinoplanes sp. NPDC049668]|uniref:PH domain-containing protein n=1 Tax=unclassified Actinoplanes TaxID=2626549 RepID=UPI0033BEEB54